MPQTINLYSISIPPMIKSLKAFIPILAKAKAHAQQKATERHPLEKQLSALLNDRLIFDQFNFIKQLQVTTDNAKAGAARLAEINPPKFEDTETTLDEIIARLEKTITFLESIDSKKVIGNDELKITLNYFAGKYFTAFEYVSEYLLPNFYFHLTTAYSILRKNGLDVGKVDFIGGLPLKDL